MAVEHLNPNKDTHARDEVHFASVDRPRIAIREVSHQHYQHLVRRHVLEPSLHFGAERHLKVDETLRAHHESADYALHGPDPRGTPAFGHC